MRVPVVLLVVSACGSSLGEPTTLTLTPLPCERSSERETLGRYETILLGGPRVSHAWTWAGGITAADLDGDGWLDLLLPHEGGMEARWGSDRWAAADRETFAAVTFATGTTVADYDGDGDLDIYVMRVRGEPVPDSRIDGANWLLRNEGSRRFTDVTESAGVAACGPHHRDDDIDRCFRTMASSWGDIDGDGDLDLFVGNYGWVDDSPGTRQTDMGPGEPSYLFHNEGDGTFTRQALPNAVNDGYTFAGGLLDLDDDGDLDLYVVNDFGAQSPNQVLFNERGTLYLDESNASGLQRPMTGMGLAAGDLNGDGWLDLVIPNWANHALLESRPDRGIWVDTAAASGLVNVRERNQLVGWGTWLGDLDNDTDLDVVTQFGFVQNGNPIWNNPTNQGDAVYLDRGLEEPSFEDVALGWGLANPGVGRGVVLADLNRDGWLDLVKRDLRGFTRLHLSRCGGHHGVLVRLEQGGPNRHAIGARLTAEVGEQRLLRDVQGGGQGFASTGPFEVHFGTGSAEAIDRLTVRWPDGARSVVKGLPTNHAVTLTRDK
ncbi:MAG: CRTAC1 family protein [Myxococcota bacterium]